MATSKTSAGLLLCRRTDIGPEVFLVHPGGPYFAHKDDGAWSIPKGLIEAGEDLLEAAKREFAEETGFEPPATTYAPLGTITQRGGKVVHAWAVIGEIDPQAVHSNTFELEWPPRSGRVERFPEVDRAAFFPVADARSKILPAQEPLIDRALQALGLMPREP